MGSSSHHHKEKKHKKEKKRSRDSDDGSEADASSSRKHKKRSRQEDQGGSDSDDKAHSKKPHKSHKISDRKKSSSSSSSRKKSQHNGPAAGLSAVTRQLTTDDYFTAVNEFSVWLVAYKGTRFEALETDDAHSKFDEFVSQWNAGELEAMYYEGSIPQEVIDAAKKTQHKWGFTAKLSDREKDSLISTSNAIKRSTDAGAGEGAALTSSQKPKAATSERATVRARPQVAQREPQSQTDDSRADTRQHDKQARMSQRAKHAAVLDEAAPKETGRQAVIDKRRTVGASLHGAARDRESNRDGLDLPASTVMGGGDDFDNHVSGVRNARAKREGEAQQRLLAAQQKEADNRAAFMAQMGLTAGQKVTIRPREP